jgi:ureidoglycolate lyase
MREIRPRVEPLSRENFAEFGDVIETEGRDFRWINEHSCKRYGDLALLDIAENGGRPLLNVFEADARALPLRVRKLERHPLSSQAFFPLQPRPFLIVVAAAGSAPIAERIRVFSSTGTQGVNFRRNTWHHSLVALEDGSRFLVVDRGGDGENCEEIDVVDAIVLVSLA